MAGQGDIRTTVYVDGFNLYGGALKRAPAGYRWLDINAMVKAILRPNHRIDAIHYFTALIQPDGDGDKSPDHQKIYIKALETYIPHLTTHYGHFLVHPARARPVDATLGQLVNYWKIEEKGSDVNLAARLVADAFLDRFDCAVLVCNDGDLGQAVRIVRQEAGKAIGAILPTQHPTRGKRRTSHELVREMVFVRKLRPSTVRQCQLPDPIPNTRFHKPAHW